MLTLPTYTVICSNCVCTALSPLAYSQVLSIDLPHCLYALLVRVVLYVCVCSVLGKDGCYANHTATPSAHSSRSCLWLCSIASAATSLVRLLFAVRLIDRRIVHALCLFGCGTWFVCALCGQCSGLRLVIPAHLLHHHSHTVHSLTSTSLFCLFGLCFLLLHLQHTHSLQHHSFHPPLPSPFATHCFPSFPLLCCSALHCTIFISRVWVRVVSLCTEHFVLGVFCLLCAELTSCLPNTPLCFASSALILFSLQAMRSARQLWAVIVQL